MSGNITDELFRGSIGDQRAFQQPGLDTFRRYIRGELRAPPISRLAGMRPSEAGLGRATFTMPVTRWLEDGFGLYWGGVVEGRVLELRKGRLPEESLAESTVWRSV